MRTGKNRPFLYFRHENKASTTSVEKMSISTWNSVHYQWFNPLSNCMLRRLEWNCILLSIINPFTHSWPQLESCFLVQYLPDKGTLRKRLVPIAFPMTGGHVVLLHGNVVIEYVTTDQGWTQM